MEKPFILDTDASNYAAGAVLSQVQENGDERPCAYFSTKFNDAEKNYCTTQRELLAVILALEHFKFYLWGHNFMVRTDHSSLRWIRNMKGTENKIARWIQRLDEFGNFTIVHRKGEDHGNADALSRLVGTGDKELGDRLCVFFQCTECTPKRDRANLRRLLPQQPDEIAKVFAKEHNLTPINKPPRVAYVAAIRSHLAKRGIINAVLGADDTAILGELQNKTKRKYTKKVYSGPVRRSARLQEQAAKTEEVQRSADAGVLTEERLTVTPLDSGRETSVQEPADNDLLPFPWTDGPLEIGISHPDDINKRVNSIGPGDPGSESITTGTPSDDEESLGGREVTLAEIFTEEDGPEMTPSNWFEVHPPDWLREEQMKDPGLAKMLDLKENHHKKPQIVSMKTEYPTFRGLHPQWEQMVISEGVLYRKQHDLKISDHPRWQLVVPEHLRPQILMQLHNGILGGHQGRRKTVSLVSSAFYWPGHTADIKAWCRKCDICSQAKVSKTTYWKVPLQQKTALGPFDEVSLDVLQLTVTAAGNKYVLMVVDKFTKWIEAYAMPEHTAPTVARVLAEEWICRYGVPRELHSDNGPEFMSKLIVELCSLFELHKTTTPTYRPQGNGQCERMNKTATQMLAKFVHEYKHQQWDRMLPYVVAAYRRSVHESSGVTPNLMVYGRETKMPLDLVVGSPPEVPKCPFAYVAEIKSNLQQAHDFARKQLKISAKKQKIHYDRYAGKERLLSVGETVWYYYPPWAQKLSNPWIKCIVRKILDQAPAAACYEVQQGEYTRPKLAHIDQLKYYEGDEPIIPWWTEDSPSEDESA
jgi:hypothetical protein